MTVCATFPIAGPVLFFSVPVSFSRSRQGRTREARAGNRGNAAGVAFLSFIPPLSF